MNRTEVIKAFLTRNAQPLLAELYDYDMECQVNVAQDNGERIEGEYKGRLWQGWSDGTDTWKPFRIPRKANSEPEYEDTPLRWDFDAHVEAIGMTGWDWVNRVSRWVAFDFDAICDHSQAHSRKLGREDLGQIINAVKEIDWVTVRRSTGGQGLHLYVNLVPVQTDNHTEHAALARAILGQLSALTGTDFSAKVDICGGNMWVWHRKCAKNPGALEVIKPGGTLSEIPPNWKDHIKVVEGKKHRLSPSQVATNADAFEALIQRKTNYDLDAQHRANIEWLQHSGAVWWWDADNNMLVTHTQHLKEMHTVFKMKGIFETATSHSSSQNCFAFPLRNGIWSVRRYTPGVQEHASWEQDGAGWTKIYMNKEPSFETAARVMGGLEDVNGEFQFSEAIFAQTALRHLGIFLDLDGKFGTRTAWLKLHKDGRILFMIERSAHDEGSGVCLPGWLVKKGRYLKFFTYKASELKEAESNEYDEVIRHLVTEASEDAGWVVNVNAKWTHEPLAHVRLSLASQGLKANEGNVVMGQAVLNNWYLVNKPFQPEYPGEREWNLGAAQLRYEPTRDTDQLQYPTWLKVLKQCGRGLNHAVENDPWCKANGLRDGGDYLKCWAAHMFQNPTRHLPYLFFYSREQNTGKTTFYESLAGLLTKGYVKAKHALTEKYNGELHGAILCAIEEVDLSSNNKEAYNKIKDWVTAKEICIRAMYKDPYHIPNTTHWVQCSNDHSYCPIFDGDTRITMIQVPPIPMTELISPIELDNRLKREAPDFLAEMLKMELPPYEGRLGLPVVATGEKVVAQERNRTELEDFLGEYAVPCPGHWVKFSDLYDKFSAWCDPLMISQWSKIRVGKTLPPDYPKGRSRKDAHHYIGNIRWVSDPEPEERGSRFILAMDGFFDLQRTTPPASMSLSDEVGGE